MTSRNRPRIEYLTSTDNILVLLLHSNLTLRSSDTDRFSIRFNDNSEVAYVLFGHPVCTTQYNTHYKINPQFAAEN